MCDITYYLNVAIYCHIIELTLIKRLSFKEVYSLILNQVMSNMN